MLGEFEATRHVIRDELKFVTFYKKLNPENHIIEMEDGSRTNDITLMKNYIFLWGFQVEIHRVVS